jgi:hypothetical protein
MSSSGSPEFDDRVLTDDAPVRDEHRRRGLLPAALIGVLLLVAVIALSREALGILYAILLPPTPPLPAGAQLITHESESYGVDTWRYSLAQDACELVTFFESNGGTCQTAPLRCLPDAGSATPPQDGERRAARCYGTVSFSQFSMRWQAALGDTSDPLAPTALDLTREVFWLGHAPGE